MKPEEISGAPSALDPDTGDVVPVSTFPCTRCNNRRYIEDRFYRQRNGNRYKQYKRCTDYSRKRVKAKALKTGATNAEYAPMFLEPTHLSSALTVLCHPHSVSAESSNQTENGKTASSPDSSSLHVNTTNETNSNNMRVNTSDTTKTTKTTGTEEEEGEM
jgi:hypothetical protein